MTTTTRRTWCGGGHFLPNDTQLSIRLADERSAFAGCYVKEDADEFDGCPYAAPTAELLREHYRGRECSAWCKDAVKVEA